MVTAPNMVQKQTMKLLTNENDVKTTASMLMMKEKWLRKIMNGTKTWEIRGSNCKKHKKKTIYFAFDKKIHGCAFLYEVEKLDLEKLKQHADKTAIPNPRNEKIIQRYLEKRGCYAYKFKNVVKFKHPVCFDYDAIKGPKRGPVTWNTLPHYLLIKCQKAIEKGAKVEIL